MNEFTIKPDIEPEDRYQKARKALISALEATSQLSQQEQMQLCQELLGTGAFINLMNILGIRIQ